jgi:hypothetical protein
MFKDVRVLAGVAALIGVLCGTLFPVWLAVSVTAFLIVVIVIVPILLELFSPSHGTSGNLGVVVLLLGASLFFLFPMWLVEGVSLAGKAFGKALR